MDIKARDAATAFITADGSQVRELIHPNHAAAQSQSLAEATLAPGSATTEHYHARSEEIYYVLQGRALLRIEGEEQEIGAGEAVVILPGHKHKIRNIGPAVLLFLCCCAPPYQHEDTFLTE